MHRLNLLLQLALQLFLSSNALLPQNNNPEKFGNHFQGDMFVANSPGIVSGKDAFRDNQNWLWPDGNVYYRLASTIKSNETRKLMITDAMKSITEEAFCVNFIDIEKDNIKIASFVDIITHGDIELRASGLGCHSEVGYQGRRQILNLQPDDCFTIRTIKHELFHVLGCVHEQSRPDVDQVLEVFIDNVKPNQRDNFLKEKYSDEDDNKGIHDFNTPYDLESIMQYPPYAFGQEGVNGPLKTMKAKDPYYRDNFGFSEDFSDIDIVELNLRYRCEMKSDLVFHYVNAYMDIAKSARRVDQNRISHLEKELEKMKIENRNDKRKIASLEDKIENINLKVNSLFRDLQLHQILPYHTTENPFINNFKGWVVKGRPFIVEGSPRTTESRAISEGNTKCEHATSTLSGRNPSSQDIGRKWLKEAEAEHASVASFARHTLQLMAIGAPTRLLTASQQASLEEIQHAKICYEFASGFLGESFLPGLLDVQGSLKSVDLDDIIRSLITEGCIGETLAAIEARLAAYIVEDTVVKAALSQIATDETKHAQLAWDTLKWIMETFPEKQVFAEQVFHAELKQNLLMMSARNDSMNCNESDTSFRKFGFLTNYDRENVHQIGIEEIIKPAYYTGFQLVDMISTQIAQLDITTL